GAVLPVPRADRRLREGRGREARRRDRAGAVPARRARAEGGAGPARGAAALVREPRAHGVPALRDRRRRRRARDGRRRRRLHGRVRRARRLDLHGPVADRRPRVRPRRGEDRARAAPYPVRGEEVVATTETERLYRTDPYLKAFEARVVEAKPVEG